MAWASTCTAGEVHGPAITRLAPALARRSAATASTQRRSFSGNAPGTAPGTAPGDETPPGVAPEGKAPGAAAGWESAGAPGRAAAGAPGFPAAGAPD